MPFEKAERQGERFILAARSWGLPAALPSGKSEKRKRGTPTCSTMSLAQPMTTVAMPAVFERAGGKADTLMADRAIGDEEGGVDLIGKAARHELRAIGLERDAMAAIGRRAMEAWRDVADAAGSAARRKAASGK